MDDEVLLTEWTINYWCILCVCNINKIIHRWFVTVGSLVYSYKGLLLRIPNLGCFTYIILEQT